MRRARSSRQRQRHRRDRLHPMGNNSCVDGDAWSGGYNSSGAASERRLDRRRRQGVVEHAGLHRRPGHTQVQDQRRDRRGERDRVGRDHAPPSAGRRRRTPARRRPRVEVMPTFTFNAANYSSVHTYNSTFPTDYTAFNTYITANKSNLSGHLLHHRGQHHHPGHAHRQHGDRRPHRDRHRRARSTMRRRHRRERDGRQDRRARVVVRGRRRPGCAGNGGNPAATAPSASRTTSASTPAASRWHNTAVLLYAPNGRIAIKNNADFPGAVYADNIQFKNNMKVDLRLPPRADRRLRRTRRSRSPTGRSATRAR